MTLSFIFQACGGDEKHEKSIRFAVMSPEGCSQKQRNQFIYDVLKDSYLWADKVGDMNISLDSTDDASFLDNFLYKEKDRFSFIISQTVYQEHFVSGTAKDFGFRSTNIKNDDNSTSTVIKYVFKGSPADKAGLSRSDKIISKTLDDIFTIENSAGVKREVLVQEKPYDVINTTHQTILEQNGKKIGYFSFKSFVGPRLVLNLNQAFGNFKNNHVSELIIDLRYNGGGLLSVAGYLGSLIGGEQVKGHVLQYNRYNARYKKYDRSTNFTAIQSQSLGLSRVIILTGEGTASASESLINGLAARENNIEVVTIGAQTYGKPFGMHTMSYCDKVLVPIHFRDENSDGVGGFVDGMKPTCFVEDTIKYDFTNKEESLLKEALYYIDHGTCSR